jgi:transposase
LKHRSSANFLRLAIESKLWAKESLSVHAARPAQCPACGAAGRSGDKVWIYGHGVRERQQRGPAVPGEAPEVRILTLRRYHCQRCGAVITCAPSSAQKHKHFSGSAIAWALALFGVLQLTVRAVRERTSPWRITGAQNSDRWASLRRWARAVKTQRLFPSVRVCPAVFTLRQVSERAAMTLASMSRAHSATAPPAVRAFFGAAQVE